jgi:hypothetical protein
LRLVHHSKRAAHSPVSQRDGLQIATALGNGAKCLHPPKHAPRENVVGIFVGGAKDPWIARRGWGKMHATARVEQPQSLSPRL